MLELIWCSSVSLWNVFMATLSSKPNGAEVGTFPFQASDFPLEWMWESAQTRERAELELIFGWYVQAEVESETSDLCAAVSLLQLSSQRHEKRKEMVDQVCFTPISMRQFSRSCRPLCAPHPIWSHLYLCPLRASSNSRNFLSETQNISPDRMEW